MSDHTISLTPARILAVIPCLNEEKHIEALVTNLLVHTADLDLQIVIADGDSQDRTPAIAQQLAATHQRVTYLHNPKRLQSAALNLAVQTMGDNYDYLIRLDAHAHYPADFCHILLAEEQATGAAAVVVPMHTVGEHGFQKAVALAQNSKLGNGGSSHRNTGGEGKWVDHGHHALMRIRAFKQVGGYDDTFSHNEDAELDHRLQLAGHRLWLTGKTALDYFPRAAARPLFLQYLRFGRGRARTILKHRIIPKIRQMVPAAVLPAAFLFLLSPWLPICALPLLGWAAICLSYGVYLGHKAGDYRQMLAGPAAMIMHMGWSIGFWQGLLQSLTSGEFFHPKTAEA